MAASHRLATWEGRLSGGDLVWSVQYRRFDPMDARRTQAMNSKLMLPTAAGSRGATPKAARGRVTRWLRGKWRCYRQTGWAHEVDLHLGVCRFCGKRVDQRL
jgi:hypothetical protein